MTSPPILTFPAPLAAAATPVAGSASSGTCMGLKDFWYVVAESHELTGDTLMARQVLDVPLVIFRDAAGRASALLDRCVHRNAPLSGGRSANGLLQCGYHGWSYDGQGCVRSVPSEGHRDQAGRPRVPSYQTCEQDGFVYVRLGGTGHEQIRPFPMPHYGERPWRRVRLQNRFQADLTRCVENFVDIPHTAYVHDRVFRSERHDELGAQVRRCGGSVTARYRNETSNLGWFSWFLNPTRSEIQHVDRFHMPNVTCVEYGFGPRRRFLITSQSVPVSAQETLVYTDLTFDYGVWNLLAAPLVRRMGQRVIDQDLAILSAQTATLARVGASYSLTDADVIHVFIESILHELARERDPRALPNLEREIRFHV